MREHSTLHKKNFLSRCLGLAVIALGFFMGSFSAIHDASAQNACPDNTTCICHNVDNQPHTICVGDPGYGNHLAKHVNNGQDACGPCCNNGSCDESDGETCSTCSPDCGECTQTCADGDADGDGICNGVDNCPNDASTNQDDSDSDGVGDLCDTCVGDNNVDLDDNGVPDACQSIPSPTPVPTPIIEPTPVSEPTNNQETPSVPNSPSTPTTPPTGIALSGTSACNLSSLSVLPRVGGVFFLFSLGIILIGRLAHRRKS